MADDENKVKSIDEILDSVEEGSKFARNLVMNSFTVGQAAYYDKLKVKGVNKKTGELEFEGDIAAANLAARDLSFEHIFRNLYLPNSDNGQWQTILDLMNDSEHSQYKLSHLSMIFGEAADSWESFWNENATPMNTESYMTGLKNFMEPALGAAAGIVQSRYITEDDINALTKEAEERIAADPDWEITENWWKNPVAASLKYLSSQRHAIDPVAANMAQDGYLNYVKKEE